MFYRKNLLKKIRKFINRLIFKTQQYLQNDYLKMIIKIFLILCVITDKLKS